MGNIDHIILSQVEKHKTPSVQYLLFDKDKVINKFQLGLADVRNNYKIHDNTTYNLFSVTKTFTALAVLQLAENGKLDIDHPVKKYLKEFPYSPEITIRQLMSHSSGIPNPLPINWVHLIEEHESFDAKLFFDKIFEKYNHVKSKPNEKFSYSNLGYVLLGRLIEKVTNLRYDVYVKKYILEKINISRKNLDFSINDVNVHSKGYQKYLSLSNLLLGFLLDKSKFMDKTEGIWKPFKNFYVNGTAHGGLIGTPIGLMNYVQEFLKSENRLITDTYRKLLFTENRTKDNVATGMCLSWFKGNLNGKVFFSHSGGGGGYYCEIRMYPELLLGSFIVFNRSGISDEHFLNKVDTYYVS